jgi:hypothetical protein
MKGFEPRPRIELNGFTQPTGAELQAEAWRYFFRRQAVRLQGCKGLASQREPAHFADQREIGLRKDVGSLPIRPTPHEAQSPDNDALDDTHVSN